MTINKFILVDTGIKKKIASLAVVTALLAASSGVAFAQTASPSPTPQPTASPTVPAAAPSTGLGGN